MAKKQKQPTKICADCIHESACRAWVDGRYIADSSASRCPNFETVKESAAYLCGVLDERNRKKTNADRIRAMSDEELATLISEITDECEKNTECHQYCYGCDIEYCVHESCLKWLQQPAEGGQK